MADINANESSGMVADLGLNRYCNGNREMSRGTNPASGHEAGDGLVLSWNDSSGQNEARDWQYDPISDISWAQNNQQSPNESLNNDPVPINPIPSQEKYITYGQMNLINDFRTLWRDLIIWLRSYMVSVVTGFSDIDAINKRLYRIPQTLNDKLQPFFGVEASEEIAQLLFMYIVQAQTLVNAQVHGDRQGADTTVKALYQTADKMAEALARLNPYWSKAQWQYLLNHLTSMGIHQIIAMVAQEHERELDIRDRMLKHALVLGDYMANGVMFFLVP